MEVKELLDSLGAVIKSEIESQGYTQKRFAKEVKISDSELSRIIAGSYGIKETKLAKIFDFLGIKVNYSIENK